MSTFWWKLRDDVKDLFLNLSDLLTLTKSITQVVRCDNRLFERRQEWCSTRGPYKAKTITPWKQAPTNASMLQPMQINSSRFQKKKER
jgi:hypothetical protein